MRLSRPARARQLYWIGFGLSGVSLTLAGPALTELRDRTGTTIAQIGGVFAAAAVGSLIGALVSGQLVDRLDGHQAHALAAFTLAAGAVAIPQLATLRGLLVAFFVLGLGSATLATASNTLVMWWGDNVTRGLNALHLCFGVGAIVAPLAAAASVDWAYRLAAVGLVLVGLSIVRFESPQPEPSGPEGSLTVGVGVMVLAATFFALYVAFELGFSGWIHTFATESGMSGETASLINSGFWIAFTAGRAAIVLTPGGPPPRAVVAASLAVTAIAAVLLVIGRLQAGPAFMIGTVLAGLGAAAQFPTALSYLDRRVTTTGAFTSIMIGASSVGSLLGPWLFGRAIGNWGPVALPWATLLVVALMTGAFAALDRRLA